jgi:hypothetical protein
MLQQEPRPFRMPADMPRLDYAGLTAWLDGETTRRLGRTVVIRKYGTAPKNPPPPVIGFYLYGTAIAFIRPDRVTFPETGDTHLATAGWLTQIVRDNGIGTLVSRCPRRKQDGPGPETSRGRAGILLIDGSRDRPLEGFAYRAGHPGGEPWCNHDGPGSIPGQPCECGQRVPLHSWYRERKARELAAIARKARRALAGGENAA